MATPKLDIELDDAYQAFLADRRRQILDRVSAACSRAGRDASEVLALAVSKTVEPEACLLAWRAGWRAFAENRPQELSRKLEFAAKRCCAHGIVQPVLLEVNVSGEQSKSGFSPAEAREAVEALAALPGIRLEGIMTMAPRADADAARRTLSGARELACELRARTGLPLPTLSCGMSDDFAIAVEEGSTLVRLGRVTFDPAYELL